MLEIKDLNKNFGDLKVLKDISFTIKQGEVVSILGPSGSGKTTLLRCLNFLNNADDGVLDFDGESIDLSQVKKKQILEYRKKTGFVFQGYNLFANKTALQNVTEGLTVVRKIKKNEAEKIAKEALEKVGLLDRADFYPSQLSGGQQQRVSIARAIATNPKIIFFDEPTSALDPELTGEVLNTMKKLADEGTTMVVVTHEIGFAQNVSDKVIFMENGSIVETAPSKDFFINPKQERTIQFLRLALPDYNVVF